MTSALRALANSFCAKKVKSPCQIFTPERVTTLTMPPAAPPNSAPTLVPGHAEFLHHLDAQCDAIAAGRLIAVIHAIDGDAVVAPAHAGKDETAIVGDVARAGGGPAGIGAGRSCHGGRGENEVEIVPILRGGFLHTLAAERNTGAAGGGLQGIGCFVDVQLLGHHRQREM